MKTLNDLVKEYTEQLQKGDLQKAYKGILSFMTALKSRMETRYPDYKTSALYAGYMDMTYFAFTPEELRKRGLKIAVVYLHGTNYFEAWLGGANRSIQSEYIERFKKMDIGDLKLSQVSPGIDSILEKIVLSDPDFNNLDALMTFIENKTLDFVEKILSILANEK